MSWLSEDALTIWALGAVALAVALVFYFETRSTKSQLAVLAAVLITAALVAVEWYLETPREAVNRTLDELAATVESNDVAGTLLFLSPKAVRMRADVEKLMPEVQIEFARILGTPIVEFDNPRDPKRAFVQLRGAVKGKVKNTSMQGTVPDNLTVHLEYDGQRWLIEDYSSERNWHRELGHK
jgi:hypothetical protein